MGDHKPFEVIRGGKGTHYSESFVCPWCGGAFAHRYITSDGVPSLEEHFARSVTCGKNQKVNNPTQEKNMIFPEGVADDD